MKYIKTFENFSPINEEEEGIKKFFTGHDSKEAREKAEADFNKFISECEDYIKSNPEKAKNLVFKKDQLEKAAKEDNYKGGTRLVKSNKDGKTYVTYKKGITGFQSLTSAAGEHRREIGL
jgi:hypothetical protein